MTVEKVRLIGTLLAVSLVWLYANTKTTEVWLEFISLAGFLVFISFASGVAIVAGLK